MKGDILEGYRNVVREGVRRALGGGGGGEKEGDDDDDDDDENNDDDDDDDVVAELIASMRRTWDSVEPEVERAVRVTCGLEA